MKLLRFSLPALFLIFSAGLEPCLVICLACLACLTNPASAGGTAFVLLGGFPSCWEAPGKVLTPYQTLVWNGYQKEILPEIEAQTGAKPEFFTACYGLQSRSLTEVSLSFQYLTSLHPNVAIDLSAHPILSQGTSEEFSNILDNATASAESIALGDRTTRFIIIGHSYGAWTAIHVARNLLDQGYPVANLFTIDPISPAGCSPGDYIHAAPGLPQGCLEAPADLDHAARVALIQRLNGNWTSFYETQDLLLHSGAIPELESAHDFELNPGPLIDYATAHRDIAADPRLWAIVRKQILGLN